MPSKTKNSNAIKEKEGKESPWLPNGYSS